MAEKFREQISFTPPAHGLSEGLVCIGDHGGQQRASFEGLVVLCLAFQQGREVMGGCGGHCSQPKYKTPKTSVNACIWSFESSGWWLPKHFMLQGSKYLHKIKKKQAYHMCLHSITCT